MKITKLEFNQDVVQCPHCGTYYIVTDLDYSEAVRCVVCKHAFFPGGNIKEYGNY